MHQFHSPLRMIVTAAVLNRVIAVNPAERLATAQTNGTVRAGGELTATNSVSSSCQRSRSDFRRRIWTPSLIRAGLPTTRLHDFRHSYASWFITDGVPGNAVEKVMGHANASTTLNRYTHPPGDYEDPLRGSFLGSADDLLTSGKEGDQDEA